MWTEPKLILVLISGLTAGCVVNGLVTRLPAALERGWRAQALQILGLDADIQQPLKAFPMVDARAVAVAAACVGMSVLVVWYMGFSLKAAALLILSWGLLALALIDAEHYLLPDNVVIPMLWLGLLVNTSGLLTSLHSAVLGAVCGYLGLWVVHQLFALLTGRDGMGYGDFKLLALLGAWGGWQLLPVILFAAALFGIGCWCVQSMFTDDKLQREQPFGPHLALAGGAAILFSDSVEWLRFMSWPY